MFNQYFEKISRLASNDIGIDLGTANTLVYFKDKGIVINEPSVVSVNQKTGRVVAVGKDAKAMLGRTPPHIHAIKPLVEGVVSDFEVTEEFLAYLLNRAQEYSKKLLGPRVIIGVPSGITNVETRAVRDAVKNAGARVVYIIEEPMAAAIGIRLPVRDPVGSMVVDIGGGTTDAAVISFGGIVVSRNIRIAGDRFDTDIVAYIRDELQMLIGKKTAEDLKIAIGSVEEDDGKGPMEEVAVRGRDIVSGLPREVVITSADVYRAIIHSVESLIESVREILESTPPEVLSDVMRRGIYLVGGGALMRGISDIFEEWLKIPVHIANDPLSAVARGTGAVLEDILAFEDMLVPHDKELPVK